MSETFFPPLKPYHPTTFLERGVAVPFTTPLLAGTRARPADKRGLELVVPNPSGGRGVYIVGWSGIAALCRPTLHDRQLNKRVAALINMTPSTMRRVGRAVAAEGLAGDEAKEAAQKAEQHDKNNGLVTNYLLLMALVAQVAAASPAKSLNDAPGAVEMQQRAHAAVHLVAPQLGKSTGWVAAALEEISDAMIAVGVTAGSSTSRVPSLINLLRRCSKEISDWTRGQRSETHETYVEMICVVADYTVTLAETTLAQAHSLTNDVVGLLRSWAVDPEPVARRIARSEWLLDGWEQICSLWDFASDDATRRAALVEIALLVPIIPKEARQWTDLFVEADTLARLRRLIPLNEDWRTGASVFDLITRNEKIRALAC